MLQWHHLLDMCNRTVLFLKYEVSQRMLQRSEGSARIGWHNLQQLRGCRALSLGIAGMRPTRNNELDIQVRSTLT